MEEVKRRMSGEHIHDPASRYIKVVDDDNNGAVVAGASWKFYENREANPHAKGPFQETE
jgi:hypothetical protein